MSKDWQSQAHVKWDCKYHVVILSKYRKKTLYGKLRKAIGVILRELCRQKEARGYCVSTVGLDEEQTRQYIREQEKLQRDLDQGELDFE